MQHSSATNNRFSAEARAILLDLARRSIAHGLAQASPLRVDLSDYPPFLAEKGASFVTLQLNGSLRGCIGALEARDPLVVDVAKHAYAAAFRDPRFPALTTDEFARIEIHLSILSPQTPLQVVSEAELLEVLRPGIDGLTLEDGRHRSTFLPSVWEQLSSPAQFLSHLKQKAGLKADYWSPTIRFFRYTTESFGDAAEVGNPT